MRTRLWLLLVLAGCAGPDADPLKVAERFHERRAVVDDAAVHALLTAADQAAVPVDAFPAGLPPRLALKLANPGPAALDSLELLAAGDDSAFVVLHVPGGAPDTLRLVAERERRTVLGLERERVRWRVSVGVAEHVRVEALAAAMRATAGAADTAAVEHARAFLTAAGRHPGMARLADMEAARTTVRRAETAAALRVDLRATQSFTGSLFVEGRVENPSRSRISTLRLVVRDAAGAEERIELWNLAPGSALAVRQISRLRPGPVTHRIETLHVF